MTMKEILNTTARHIAQTLSVDEIKHEFANLTMDDDAMDFIGSYDPADWVDMNGDEMIAMVNQDMEYNDHDAATLAANLMLSAAWIEATKDE